MYPEEKEQVRQLQRFLIWTFFFVLILKLFYVTTFEISGNSMLPNYHDKERIVAEKVSYRMHDPKYGDVVIVKLPKEQGGTNIIKRVVGKAGDTLEVKSGTLYRNGKMVKELYIKERMEDTMFPYVVPQHEFFVMGDNRNNSSDSRVFGPFEKEQIIAKVWFQW